MTIANHPGMIAGKCNGYRLASSHVAATNFLHPECQFKRRMAGAYFHWQNSIACIA